MKAPWDPRLVDEPAWPEGEGPFLFLIDASSELERQILEEWIDRNRPDGIRADWVRIPQTRRRRRRPRLDPHLEARLRQDDDPTMVPLRIAWLAREQDGRRRVSLRDVLVFGDPRDPNLFRQRYVRTFHPDRLRILQAAAATKSDIEKRWQDPTGRGPADGTTLAEFVALKAWLALERAERALRGARYKVPKFLREDLFWSRGFQQGIARLAIQEGKTLKWMQNRTSRYLKETAATHSPYAIDVVTALTGWVISLGYQSVNYDPADLQRLYQTGREHPLVFLPSHKSNVDHLVLQFVLYENEYPPNHTAGGDNLNFFPIGPILRRSGIFFIRRESKANDPYKFTLRRYIDYLLEKRFPLEWFIEGGRSRTGKMREPRLGLLAYVVEAYMRGLVDDVVLIPVSIAYDQISDVGSYTSEQRGGRKEQESFSWTVKFLQNLHRRYGSIHLRFGEPMRLREAIPEPVDTDTDEGRLLVPRLAFAISNRINAITPITPISLVTLALLSRHPVGLTVAETMAVLEPFLVYVERRNLPTTAPLTFDTPEQVAEALNQLAASGVVSRVEGLTENVFVIEYRQSLAAAYYRNTIIHFFVNGSIVEVALAGMLRDGTAGLDDLQQRAFALRDLFKFEFFFEDRERFREEIVEELGLHCGIGRELVDRGDIAGVLASFSPIKSPAVLRPFLAAYRLVADVVADVGPYEELDVDEIRARALQLGQQYIAKGIIRTPEAVSTALFSSAVKLAENRGILTSGKLRERREFADEITTALADIDGLRARELQGVSVEAADRDQK
jgi:glycerol-3-phosphate O-acyltransferase